MDDKPYYWIIETWDKEKIRVKPQYATAVQNKIDTGTGFIRMPNRSINDKDIKGFELSDIVVSDQKLLEEASTAFGDPIITKLDDGSEAVKGTCVKKNIKRNRFDKYFKNHPSYIPIKENENSITVAFIVPTHLVDLERVTKMNVYEIEKLRKS